MVGDIDVQPQSQVKHYMPILRRRRNENYSISGDCCWVECTEALIETDRFEQHVRSECYVNKQSFARYDIEITGELNLFDVNTWNDTSIRSV